MSFRIGELAKLAGCLPVTIRFYEKEGLLRKPERGQNNYRLYDLEDAHKLCFISHCRKHGLSLEEIKNLLLLREQKNPDCHQAHAMVESCIEKITAKIDSLMELRNELVKLKNHACCKDHCAILTHLERADDCECCAKLK